uniref:hypothetical protein n=1 Tax=Actinomadura sp. CA-154981 TaxID=3240037 RepID=UPI003F4934EF
MTNQIPSSAADSRPEQAEDRRTEYFVIITTKSLRCGAWVKETYEYITLVEAGTNLLALVDQVNREIPQRMQNQKRIFFYAEPNQIAPGEYLVMAAREGWGRDHQPRAMTDLFIASSDTRATLYWRMKFALSKLGGKDDGCTVFFLAKPNRSISA